MNINRSYRRKGLNDVISELNTINYGVLSLVGSIIRSFLVSVLLVFQLLVIVTES